MLVADGICTGDMYQVGFSRVTDIIASSGVYLGSVWVFLI